jgi:hypothetical protein
LVCVATTTPPPSPSSVATTTALPAGGRHAPPTQCSPTPSLFCGYLSTPSLPRTLPRRCLVQGGCHLGSEGVDAPCPFCRGRDLSPLRMGHACL